MLFSLILPTYNVERYIATCLESCCTQEGISPSDYEIIIVNDETPDSSIDVAKKVIERYPKHNWKIVNRKNGGLSAARNSGMDAAVGKYLWFIDSDDYIEKKSLSILSEIVACKDYDIVNFTHKTIYKDKHIVGGKSFDAYETTGAEYLAHTDFLSAWTLIYKREFLLENNLRFKEGFIWEDSEFNIRAYMLTKKCLCVSNALYYYIRRENSISDLKATPYSTHSRISNVIGLEKFISSREWSKEEKKIMYTHLAKLLVGAIAGLPELEMQDRIKYRGQIRLERNLNKNIFLNCADKKYRIMLFAFFIWPKFAENYLNIKIHEAIINSKK